MRRKGVIKTTTQLGLYERAVHAVLQTAASGPWTVIDLSRVRATLDEALLAKVGLDCKPAEICDWLAALPMQERGDLIERLNEQAGSERAGGRLGGTHSLPDQTECRS